MDFDPKTPKNGISASFRPVQPLCCHWLGRKQGIVNGFHHNDGHVMLTPWSQGWS